MTLLKELKLNDNKIMSLPDLLQENLELEIFDIGNNEIKDLKYCFLIGNIYLFIGK